VLHNITDTQQIRSLNKDLWFHVGKTQQVFNAYDICFKVLHSVSLHSHNSVTSCNTARQFRQGWCHLQCLQMSRKSRQKVLRRKMIRQLRPVYRLVKN